MINPAPPAAKPTSHAYGKAQRPLPQHIHTTRPIKQPLAMTRQPYPPTIYSAPLPMAHPGPQPTYGTS